MRFLVSSTALGLVLVAGATAANAQTVITQPMQTVQTTTETVRTVRPAHREVVTTRTVTRQIAPAPTVIARTVPAGPPRLYDTVAPPATIAADADYSYSRPLYDVVTSEDQAVAGVATPYIYRYVYEPDRILVIDPNTNIAVQALPR